MDISDHVFKTIENRYDVYRGKDCMQMFCESFKDHAVKIIVFFKKMKLLTKELQASCKNVKSCYISQENFKNKYVKIKKYREIRDHCHYTGEYTGTAHSIYNLVYSAPKKIPIAFHSGCNYDYHFIIKELAEDFEKQLTYLGGNTKQYVTFTVPIEKEKWRGNYNKYISQITIYW